MIKKLSFFIFAFFIIAPQAAFGERLYLPENAGKFVEVVCDAGDPTGIKGIGGCNDDTETASPGGAQFPPPLPSNQQPSRAEQLKQLREKYEKIIADEERKRREQQKKKEPPFNIRQNGNALQSNNFIISALGNIEFKKKLLTVLEKGLLADSNIEKGRFLKEKVRVTVDTEKTGAGGATSFNFDRGEVGGFVMNIQGPATTILDSVAPHEVHHIVCALETRCPLPRWVDEGLASLQEAPAEISRQYRTLQSIMGKTGTLPYTVSELMKIKEYPTDMQKVMALYVEGTALSDFLRSRLQTTDSRASRAQMLLFAQDANEKGLQAALKIHGKQFNISPDIGKLEQQFRGWVDQKIYQANVNSVSSTKR